MENNKILGMLKIAENGLCKCYKVFNNIEKKIDPQLISGFLYALSKFTSDFLGEDIKELKTMNYKLLFQKVNEEILVYIVNEDLMDYSILKTGINNTFNYVIVEIPNIT